MILTSGQTEFYEEIGIIEIKICTLSGALGFGFGKKSGSAPLTLALLGANEVHQTEPWLVTLC